MSGDLIRHHVTNAPISEDSIFYPISNFLNSISIPFNKHVLMLWIAAVVTLIVSLWATRRYRKNIKSSPKGISHIYEMLLEFIKQAIEKYPEKVREYKSGKKGLIGLFMGEVMKLSKGKADPKLANKLVREELEK